MQIISGQYCLIRTDKSSNLFCKWHTSVSNTDGKRESSKGTRTRQLSLFHKRKWQVVDGRFRLMNQLIVFWAGRRSDHRPLQTLAGVGCWHGNRRCWSTCDWPARSCSSVGSHAWHAPLVEFPAACHIQVYVCWHTSVCMVWHQTTCRALLTSVPGRPLLRSADANKLLVPRSCTASFGPCSFSSSGLTAWNDMPAHLRNLDLTLSDFRQLLKTTLFQTFVTVNLLIERFEMPVYYYYYI